MSQLELDEAPVFIGMHWDHNAGFVAIQNSRVIAYEEFERVTRKKNETGLVGRMEQWINKIPSKLIGGVGTTDLQQTNMLVSRGAKFPIYDISGLHSKMHVLSILPLPGLTGGRFLTLVFDAGRPRIGSIELSSHLKGVPRISASEVHSPNWFVGSIFSDFFMKIFYGASSLSNCGKLMGLSSCCKPAQDDINWLKDFAAQAFDSNDVAWKGYQKLDPTELSAAVRAKFNVNSRNHDEQDVQRLAAAAQELFSSELVTGLAKSIDKIAHHGKHRGGIGSLPSKILYGGGCALSIVTTRRIREELQLDVISPPYAHDASQFVGGAVYAALQAGFGFDIGKGWDGVPQHTHKKLCRNTIRDRYPSASEPAVGELARRLFEGDIVGVARGGSEAGPRALGYRSILASPFRPGVRRRVSEQLKKREWYRPISPVIHEQKFRKYFGEKASNSSIYMLDAFKLQKEWRTLFAAVSDNHGVCRPQAVSKETDPWLWELLEEYSKLSGHPVLINTSLNAPNLPIAYGLEQIIRDAGTIGLDSVYLDGILVNKSDILTAQH